jgi:hypothetical protein
MRNKNREKKWLEKQVDVWRGRAQLQKEQEMNNTNGLREPYREATQNRAEGEHARRGKEGEKHQKEIQKPFPTSLKRNNK